MNIQNCSTPDLLSVLVGKGMAKKLSQVPLSVLFGMRANRQEMVCENEAPYVPAPIISAAKELFVRALEEDIHNHPVSFTAPKVVKDYLRLVLGGRQQEVFMVLFLDAQNHVIDCEEMFRGTLTQTSVYPREVVKRALLHNAGAVILAHNHPSGLAEPSHADEVLTATLKRALALVDVKVLDHFVVGSDSVLSFVERGLV